MDSLLAIAIVLLNLIISNVGFKPSSPEIADIVKSILLLKVLLNESKLLKIFIFLFLNFFFKYK